MEEKKGMQTLERGLRVLEYLASVNLTGAAVQEIARKCELARPVVYRILATLGEFGYVQRDQSDRFRLGVSLIPLAASALLGNDFARVSAPEVESLRDATEASVRLFVRRGTERVCIQRVYGSEPSRIINIGDVLSLQTGASGRVILAFDDSCPETERQKSDPKVLEEARANGWVLMLNEKDRGVGVIAVPVFRAQVFEGALSLALPVQRVDGGRHEQYLPLILDHARRLSQRLMLI